MRYRSLIAALIALCFGFLAACSQVPDVKLSDQPFTYDQIKDSGFANFCPQLRDNARGSIPIDKSQSYSLVEICVQPTSFFVKEEARSKRAEAEFIAAKPLTRYTTSLNQVSGDIVFNDDGSLTFVEKAGMDFQPITVQLPGGEQVPFFFTMKNLIAQTEPDLEVINTSTDFEGDYNVPSYRGASFLDPKGRGEASGYDNAVALPAQADEEDYIRSNVKRTTVRQGHMTLQVAQINSETGEIAGVFESDQPSDTDLGAQDPLEVKVRGIFYAQLQPSA
ncbi:MAG: photosystem II manganese-stabilizing polypeptide [Cyanobacteriota bacterium]|nr:photosystem II manganese-stabilizing polypeptide [Cyanobacteriota bacterium]